MTSEPIRMTSLEFAMIRGYVEQQSGIKLAPTKEYLVETRLRPLLRDHSIASFGELLLRAQKDHSHTLRDAIVDAITTNETFWFRDEHPFACLEHEVLPRVAKEAAGTRPVRIWSAAAATGQESYSIAMIIQECRLRHAGLVAQRPEILATDIAPSVLDAARVGVYSEFQVSRGLGAERRSKYFKSRPGGLFDLTDEIRSMVTFQIHNLKDSPEMLGRFDVVFLRNVLIYFSDELRRHVFAKVIGAMYRGGYLFLGGSEDIAADIENLKRERHGRTVVYRRT